MTKTSLRVMLMSSMALLVWGASAPVVAQGQGALVIQGGTLIDGMGGAPVPNSVVVIQGNRITAVGRAGAVQVPAGAQLINANGKFVLPGLWDNQNNFAWFWGELDLNSGVTTAVDIGDGEEESVAVKGAVNLGHLVAPRQLVAIGHLGGAGNRQATGLETPLSTRQLPKTVDEAKATADRLLAAGADMIQFHDGHFPAEFYKAAYDEAHKAGKPGFCRCGGPVMGPKEGAEAGADWFPHSTGIGAAIAKDGARAGGGELGNYANMDDAKANDLIKILVAHHVALVPTIVHDSPGYPKDWPRMEAEARKVMSNPDLLAYYDEDFLKNAMNVYDRAKQPGAVTPENMKGYQNMLRWNKMYDAAGGHVLPGGDTNQGKVPGNILHDEMESFQEAGIPQMHIIEGATEWAAEAMRVQNNVGSVTQGKLADVIIVDADPLQDVANLRKVSTVVLNGKTVALGYHASYSSPFQGSADDRFVVERLPWVTDVKKETFGGGGGGGRGGGGVPDPLESPQPAVETLTPYAVAQGTPAATLTIKGFNFVRRTRVYVDGVSMPYTRVSPTELAVTLDANFLARAGRYDVTVKNPGPVADPSWGDGTSNPAHFMVTFKN